MRPSAHSSAPAVAVVTGAGRGVGLAVARRLAVDGMRVGLAARSKEQIAAAAAEIRDAGGGTVAVTTDVTDEAAVRAMVETVEQELGPVELLVNNAGSAAALGPAWEVDAALWWGDVEASLRGTFLCSRAVLPGMVARRRGRIVNVSSYVAVRPSPYLSAYAAAKAAVLSFTEALAAEVAEHGIRVFAVTPGHVRTELVRYMLESEEGRRWLPHVARSEPLEPERVAALVSFLASGRGDALSGRFLHVLDDVEELVRRAEEVRGDDLYVPRLRALE